MKLPIPNFLKGRPRILNVLHLMHLIEPFSSTNEQELACIGRYASGRKLAVEIGTSLGVSAAHIAGVLHSSGRLYCVDPFQKSNPVSKICQRALRRTRVADRVTFLRGFSATMAGQLPKECEFFFVDGDHSYEGLKTDWNIVLDRLAVGGVACFHDTTNPLQAPDRDFGSVRFFDEVIRCHPDFQVMENCYTLNVLKRVRR